jgi:thymidylate synthase
MITLSTTDFEKIYQDMFNTIREHGEWSSDKVRTKYKDGTPALRKQFIGYQFRFDNSGDIAPLVRSRFIPVKSAISELIWIWIKQSNIVQDLRDMGCKYWNEWERADGTIGPAYGYVIGRPTFGHKSQLHYILHELVNNPDSTRMITNLWDVTNLHNMALTPCVYETQWTVTNNKVVLEVGVRSNDLALGLPSNIYQYAVLHKIVANEVGLPCGDLIYRVHNLHYYDRHEAGLIEQFDNYNKNIVGTNLDTLPIININNDINIWDFKNNDVTLVSNNKDLPKYSYEIAV